MKHFLAGHNGGLVGIQVERDNDLFDALRDFASRYGTRLDVADIAPVSQDVYDETVLDVRFEDGGWQQ